MDSSLFLPLDWAWEWNAAFRYVFSFAIFPSRLPVEGCRSDDVAAGFVDVGVDKFVSGFNGAFRMDNLAFQEHAGAFPAEHGVEDEAWGGD